MPGARVGVSSGLRGWFAVKYDDEGPIQTAPSSHATPAEAWEDARSWGQAEGLPVDSCSCQAASASTGRVAPSSEPTRKKTVRMAAWDDTKGRGECRSCQAAIWWYQLTSGKRHPFNAGGQGEPPVYLMTERRDGREVAHIDAADSHFATCPQSKNWKGKGHAHDKA